VWLLSQKSQALPIDTATCIACFVSGGRIPVARNAADASRMFASRSAGECASAFQISLRLSTVVPPALRDALENLALVLGEVPEHGEAEGRHVRSLEVGTVRSITR
jgi:hypothetical protein